MRSESGQRDGVRQAGPRKATPGSSQRREVRPELNRAQLQDFELRLNCAHHITGGATRRSNLPLRALGFGLDNRLQPAVDFMGVPCS